VIPAPFEYVRPASREAAFAALADPEAKVIAGGHSLLPMMKLRMATPGTLVDIAGLGLGGIDVEGSEVRIGAMTTYADILEVDPRIGLPDVLRECAAAVGDMQIRNAGTVGGAVAHGDPASDFSAGVLAVGGRLVLESSGGTRTVAADDFFVSPFTTALEQQELLVEIVVPQLAAGSGSAYATFEDAASGYPLIGSAAVVSVEGGRFASCTIGLCGVVGKPVRGTGLEAVFGSAGGEPAEDDLRAAVAEIAELDDYRTHLASVAIRRSVVAARKRAE
jgi:carbon-monoxide dehydrogenase medium subunit